MATNDERLWALAKDLRDLINKTHPIVDDSKSEAPRPFMDPDYGAQYAEHLEAAGPVRIRVLRMKTGATKIVIIDESWLKTTYGRE